MKPISVSAMICCSLVATASVAEGEGDELARTPAAPASGPSLVDRLKGLMPGMKSSPGTADASAPQQTPAQGTPTKIKDIDKVGKVASTVVDLHCKDLVEPFGLTDSALSLAKLRAKLTLEEFVGGSGTGQRSGGVKATVQQAARQLNWLPMPLERQIGQEAHEKKVQAGELLPEKRKGGANAYANARRMLARVVAQVGEPHPYQFTIHVMGRSTGAAEAAPGGFLYVDKDLVTKAANEPRATFALAHEVAHVLQRHQTRELQARLTDGIDSLDGLQQLISSANGDPTPVLLRARNLKRLFMLHSEQQELQADACSVRLLDAMMVDKRELVAAVDAFAKSLPPALPPERRKHDADVMKELGDGKFSSHPNTSVRVQNLATMLREVRSGR